MKPETIEIDVAIKRRAYWRKYRLAFCEGAGLMSGIVIVLAIAKAVGL